jgi:hypothetical protein
MSAATNETVTFTTPESIALAKDNIRKTLELQQMIIEG